MNIYVHGGVRLIVTQLAAGGGKSAKLFEILNSGNDFMLVVLI